MAKGLIVGLPLHGHMTPLLALVRDLVLRGDDLVVYSTPAFAAAIEHAGARFRRYGLNIVYTSREFQPCSDSFDRSFHFVGPPVGPRAASGTESPAEFSWPAGTRPIVYVSLGTLFNTDAAFYRHCFEALSDEPVQVIISIGSRLSPSALGAAPANCKVGSFMPQLEVLQRAAAFVTHGGMNSVSESLRMGVPMLTVPQMGEQELVSRRVEQLLAGVYLAKDEASPDRLRLGVRRLLAEERFRKAAAGLGKTLLGAGGIAAAAALVKAFVASVSAGER